MSDKAWKACERKTARFFGSVRTPLSGSNSGHDTKSDTLHKTIYVECKQGKKWIALAGLFKRTVDAAGKEGKIPVVAIHPKHCGELLIFRRKDVKCLELNNGEKYDGNVSVKQKTKELIENGL